MRDHFPELKKLIHSFYPLPDEDWTELSLIWRAHSAGRKEVLTVAGETEKYLYFVAGGVQRVYYYDGQHREATIVFTYAPSFGGVLDSMILQCASRYTYETLTPSVFLRAPFTDLKDLMERRPSVERLVRQGITQSLSGVLERLVELQSFPAEERFKKLLERSPHILQLVPHKYLANYLGIDPTNFSKFINRIRI